MIGSTVASKCPDMLPEPDRLSDHFEETFETHSSSQILYVLCFSYAFPGTSHVSIHKSKSITQTTAERTKEEFSAKLDDKVWRGRAWVDTATTWHAHTKGER